ncbi:putative RNA-directed DNA polymerase [Helianthus debilis subsp. tardiflorus]
MVFRFSCPQTSPQNGKAERMLRRLNNIIRALLTHARLPPSFWVEALHAATYLHNILPTPKLNHLTPAFALYQRHPTYDHLRVFGCACYPNVSATQPHKLSSRSTKCIFLGYPANFRGYRCLDPQSGRVHISRHVVFDEHEFPFNSDLPLDAYKFFDEDTFPFFSTPMTTPNVPEPPPPHRVIPPTTPLPTAQTPVPDPSIPAAQNNSSLTPPTSAQQPTPAQLDNTAQLQNQHHMRTRSKTGIHKPNPKFNLSTPSDTRSISPIPNSHLKALLDPNWHKAMTDEFSALQVNRTWELVPRPSGVPIVRCMWLYRHKFKSNGQLERYKARLVVNGKSQTVGIDCHETFSPVVKPATIRTVLSLAVSRQWPIHQLDVKNAFLHGNLDKTVFMFQPPGFVDKTHPDFVCRLRKSLYGLKQAPRTWYNRFSTHLLSNGFKSSICDSSLFTYQRATSTAYLLLYVDDIVITASDMTLLQNIISMLSREFAMTDLGPLHHFLGIAVTRDSNGLFLSQSQYARDIIHRANMTDCKPCATPCDTGSKLSATDGDLIPDGTLYRSLAGALQYLTFTRPDITYAVQQGTLDHGLHISVSPSSSLVAYSDADWGGCPDSRRSTSGYCVFLGDNLVSWSSKRQNTISRSSAEAEYRGVANAVAETTWLRNLLLELHVTVQRASIIYCDNVSAVYLSANPVQHQRTKHVEMDIHFVREKVQIGHVKVLHVPSSSQYADIFTKGLPRTLFTEFRSSLRVRTLQLRGTIN